MAFKAGDKKPANSGIKKGQKQNRVTFRDMLEAEFGEELPIVLGRRLKEDLQSGELDRFAETLKTALPYCYKKLPTDHTIKGDIAHKVDYTAILRDHGITPRETKNANNE